VETLYNLLNKKKIRYFCTACCPSLSISQFLGFFHRLLRKTSKVFRDMNFSYPQVKEFWGGGVSTDVSPIGSAMVSEIVNLYSLSVSQSIKSLLRDR
jgi:hypothetical protein